MENLNIRLKPDKNKRVDMFRFYSKKYNEDVVCIKIRLFFKEDFDYKNYELVRRTKWGVLIENEIFLLKSTAQYIVLILMADNNKQLDLLLKDEYKLSLRIDKNTNP